MPTPLKIDLANQTALVTGASRGIGRAIARSLADSGAWVACIARNTEKLNELVAEIQAAGGQAQAFTANVADKAAVDQTVETIQQARNRIDILVNNAGITRDGLILNMEDDQWQQVIDTNLTSTFYWTRAVSRHMLRARYGRIINLTSISGVRGNAGQSNYAASKAGIIGFTLSLAKELGKRGITVNAVAPGFISTDMTGVLPEAVREEVKKHTALRRLGEPHEVADLVAFLASPHSAYITAQVIGIDGGLVL